MSNPSNASTTGIAGAALAQPDVLCADGELDRFNADGGSGAWLDELEALANCFGCGVSADMAAMSCTQLWALYGFLKAKAGGE